MAAEVVAEGTGGQILVGYAGSEPGWRYDPGAGWIAVPSVSAHIRRGMWRAPTTASTAPPQGFPGNDAPPTPDEVRPPGNRRA